MRLIYSESEPTVLLHVIHKKQDFENTSRNHLVSENEFLQCSVINGIKDTEYLPHFHLMQERNEPKWIPQESWVVIQGSVRVFYYDMNNKYLTTERLEAGDVSITLRGGHGYRILTDDTFVYEFKTGRYLGQSKDKMHIRNEQ